MAGVTLSYLGSKSVSYDSKLSIVSKALNREVDILQVELDIVSEWLNLGTSKSPFTEITNKYTYPFFLFEQGRITYWSDNHFVPSYQDISATESLDFIELRQGQFVVVKKMLQGTNRQLVGLIPIFHNSQIDNQHLKSSVNAKVFANSAVKISKYQTDIVKSPICIYNECLFYVSFEENYSIKDEGLLNTAMILIFITVFMSLLLAINLLVMNQSSMKNVGFFTAFLILIRLAMFWANFPQRLNHSKVFDPRIFASSMLNASLGEMLLNILFLMIFVIGLISATYDKNESSSVSKLWRWLWTVTLTLFSHLALFLQFLIIQTLYSNSRYTLDVTRSINFSYDRVVVYIVFVLGAILFFMFSHFCYSVIKKLNRDSVKTMWIQYLIGTIIFTIILIGLNHPVLSVALGVMYFSIIMFYNLLDHFKEVNYIAFIYLFLGILVATATITHAIDYFEKVRIEDNKERFADHFLIGNDVLAEFLLAEAIDNIQNDVFIKTRMFSPFMSNKNSIREKIKKVYLNRYFDRYDLKIRLFNRDGEIYGDNGKEEYAYFKKSFGDKNKTSYKDLFYVNKLGANFTKRYVSFIDINNYGLTTGHIVLDLRLKKIIPDNVYPELLVDSRFLLPFENKGYSYAIYQQEKLLSHSGDFNYQNDFESSYLSSKSISINGFDHLILEDDEGRKVVVSSKEYSWEGIVSNFSFLLLILMFIVVLILLGYTIYFYLSGSSLNYSARIQLYFNLAFFLPLFAVSVTTVSLVTASYKEEVEYEHFKKALLISRNLEESLKEFSIDADKGELENSLASIAGFSNTDANLFDVKGRLVATSQPLIYKKAVMSPYLASHAMNSIISQGQNHLTIGERVGELAYNATYVAIKENNTGEMIGVLSVPYFESEDKLEKEKIEVFTTILNIFTLVFLVFLVISYFASKWLTFPLLFITQKLKQTTLSEKNEPLEWNSNDEIGLMVSEYNKMVVNLEDSKRALARTQKESAWREVAQQVAHEIKNPITPMKLTLQYLKRMLGERSDLEQIQKPVETLLNQVDTLSEIATSFSTFAKMPMPEQEEYELTKVVKDAVTLFGNHEIDQVNLEITDEEVWTIGDEQLMGRILSNIIINAKQSVGDDPIEVLVKLTEIENNKLMILVQDNGMGIPEDIQEKIFIPNFTTKTSGSGIGLAIAKHGIEQSGGKIWFETETGKGTTFYIELPKIS